MSTPREDCTGDTLLAVGKVRGLRAWRLDVAAGAVPPLRPAGFGFYTWRAGVNVATCPITQRTVVYWNGMSMFHIGVSPNDDHPVASPHCSCGFYAYHDGTRFNTEDDVVYGVIEGWGHTTIGTKGFRCEKARIVALHVPDGQHGKWPDRAWAAAVLTNVGFMVTMPTHTLLQYGIWVIGSVLNGLIGLQTVKRIRRRHRQEREHAVYRTLLEVHYPQVPIYATVKAMTADYPPDPAPDA